MTTRRPVQVIRRQDAEMEAAPPDPDHRDVGEMAAAWGAAFVSGDRMLEAGYWDFSGAMETSPFDGRELTMVVLSGRAQVETAEGRIEASAGEAVVHDGPVPTKTMRSDGFEAVYVTRFRTKADLDLARPSQ